MAYRLIDRPAPPWTRIMWESQAASFAVALDADELVAVQRLYATLAAVTEYRDRLHAVADADAARPDREVDMPFDRRVQLAAIPHFPSAVQATWPELERIVTETRAQGNPLGSG